MADKFSKGEEGKENNTSSLGRGRRGKKDKWSLREQQERWRQGSLLRVLVQVQAVPPKGWAYDGHTTEESIQMTVEPVVPLRQISGS